MMALAFGPGNVVAFDWGLDEVEALVLEVYERPGGRGRNIVLTPHDPNWHGFSMFSVSEVCVSLLPAKPVARELP